jgi:hypothetical protein
VRQPIDAAQTFVLGPLTSAAATDPTLAAALATYKAAPPDQQVKWAAAYGKAVTKVRFVNGVPVVPAANDGPVPVMLASELALARSGAIDADLSASQPFYGTDFTKPLLFLEDGAYYADKATAEHLTGDQWGVMNETGSYPGQPWLWLYQLWVPPARMAELRQHRPDRHLHDRPGHPAAAGHPVHPRPARHPEVDPGAPADLAGLEPAAGRSGRPARRPAGARRAKITNDSARA